MTELTKMNTFKVSIDTYVKLRKLARMRGKRISDIVREAITKYVWVYVTEYDLQRVYSGGHGGG